MKTENEIQRVHDIIIAVIRKEVPTDLDFEEMDLLAAQGSALCWALGHDHKPARKFQRIIDEIEKALTKRGYVLRLGPPPDSN